MSEEEFFGLGILRNVFLLLVGLLVIGFGTIRISGAAEIVDRIVAVVNGDIITLSELERASKSFYETLKIRAMRTGQELPPLTQLRRQVLDFLINKKLTDQESQKLGITVTDQDVDGAIENMLEERGITRLQMMEGLKSEGKTLDDLRQEIRQNIQRSRLINRAVKSKIVITDEDIKDYYEKHIGEFTQKAKWHLHVIYLPYPTGGTDKDKEEVDKLAVKLKKQLDGGASFAAMARQYSQGPGAKEGGDIGYLAPGDLDEYLRKAIANIPSGGLSDPVKTDDGIYIFRVDNIEEGESKSLEESKSSIRRFLYQREVNKRYEEWLRGLRQRSYIRINL